ncbi:hypothetical protein J3R82DRAFT_7112 [Butyriboletus roseoflavus]|nr:hypothetical protein J3R82DRAFT_7112 [Butyriboletus roseoflavus]
MTDISTDLCFKPLGKKRALLIAIRHVHRKPESSFSNLANLEFAHRDAEELPSHGYQADDVILMMDDKNYPEHLWPIREGILAQIDRLTSDPSEDCHFFFYCESCTLTWEQQIVTETTVSGHGLEAEIDNQDRTSMRANGQDDGQWNYSRAHARAQVSSEIVSADGKPILDYVSHSMSVEYFISYLRSVRRCCFQALFNCCHSETLLDLQRANGPNIYSRVWKIGPGQMFKDLATVTANLLKMNKERKRNNVPPAPERASSKSRSPPTYQTREVGELSVICLSACRDGQLAHDDRERGLTFTKVKCLEYYHISELISSHFKCFMNAMAAKPNITWTELRDALGWVDL